MSEESKENRKHLQPSKEEQMVAWAMARQRWAQGQARDFESRSKDGLTVTNG